MEQTVYLRMRHRVQVHPNETVVVGQIAMIVADEEIKQRIEGTVIRRVNMSDKNIVIIDLMKVINELNSQFKNLSIQTVGPSQTIIEVVYRKRNYSFPLFIAVWLLLFIGASLAIMNFHEDVSMRAVHQKIFYMLTGIRDEKPLLLQIPYSIGLGLGMVLFFNHLFRKRINEEPSPLEVEMFNYQQDLDQYVIMNENKESMKHIDDR
ncbi:stage V sporulation protein AA [Metabacillus iocasae]|uniref:Stage V sporulation protein AA n=1 Tax=Priestia iocasae TaxID=2291674 RepID=A0ABS2QR16_9BACI|nr:stage V sporulation protein AA [Metabacillus iocasae]MBM7701658.1 stage V sporulation protein AA [Metabacillus iocasae]